MFPRSAVPRCIPLVLALVALTLLGGCMSDPGEEAFPYASFDEARAAEGPVLEPETGDTMVRLKLLDPSESTVGTGDLEVLVLLFDPETGAPVTDADFGEDQPQCGASHGFCAEMIDMGHGTSPEDAPEHEDHGVYHGMTTINMAGNWTIHFRPQIDGQIVEYSANLRASE